MVFDTAMADNDTRIALVTGASRGIGLAIARRLAADGLHAVLSARSADAIEGHAKDLRNAGLAASAVRCDVSDRASTAALLETIRTDFGRLDVLVNNAGTAHAATLAESLEYEDWDRTLEVNVTAPFFLASRAKPLMPRGGVVINVSSTAAMYPSRGLAAYNVSKAGVSMLTRVLALEWAREGIRVVGVAPGKIDTEMLEPIKAWVAKHKLAPNPLDRLGQAEEVAELVAYLAGERAAFITGSVLPVDGGELLSHSGPA